MAKKSSKKSKSKKPSKKQTKPENKAAQKKPENKAIHEHLFAKVSIPVILLILIVMLAVIRVPYEATVVKMVDEEYEEEYETTETVYVGEEEVCEQVPLEVSVTEDPFSPFVDPYGTGHRCKAEIDVRNTNDFKGEWTYKYVFVIDGDEFESEEKTYEIVPGLGVQPFVFTSDVCEAGDKVTGYYVLVEGPTGPECHDEDVYEDRTVTKTRTAVRKVPQEETVQKTETLWQLIVGANKADKS